MATRALKVAVLGAGGTIGPALVRDLAESEEVAELLLIDLRHDRAQEVSDRHGGGKSRVVGVGLGDQLAEIIESADLLLNSASYRSNLGAMRAALACGCHYFDLGGLYWVTGQQLELHNAFVDAQLLGLLGIGASPGKTNVMARAAADQLGGADKVQINAAGFDPEPGEEFSVPYALRTIVDELKLAPVVLEDGRAIEVKPLTAAGAVDFPEPVGRRETFYTLHSELATLPQALGLKQASFRLSLDPRLVEYVKTIFTASDAEIDRQAREAKQPSARTVATHVVDVSNGAAALRASAITTPHVRWGLGGGIVSTATPACAAVRLLARGELDAVGVRAPEECMPTASFFAELADRGTVFTGLSL